MSSEAKATKEIAIRPLRASDALRSSTTFDADLKRWDLLIQSGALPKHVRTPEMAITIARIGELYGWDSMRALRAIFLVEGRPEMSAESMLALIREKCPEAMMQPIEMLDDRVTIRVTRPPQVPDPVDVTVTIGQFDHLAKKDNWKHYPGDMLWARCVSRVARRIFPDVVAGAYTVGEVEEKATVRLRQVGPQEVEMPTAEESTDASVTDAEIVDEASSCEGTAPAPIEDDYCELCYGESGQHTDPECPNRDRTDDRGATPREEGDDAGA